MSGYEPEQPPLQEREAWAPPRPPVAQQRTGAPPCLLYGAIGCGVVLVLLVVIGVIAFFGISTWIAGLIEDYTDTEPVTLPTLEGADEAFQELQARVEAFKTAVENNEPTAPLELSEWDLNALVQLDPEWEELKGKIYISIADDLLRGEVSIPLDLFEFEAAKGRYFNGSATFDVSLRHGTPYVHITEAEVKGEAIPDEIMGALRAKNLAENSQQDAETKEMLRRLESIEVTDGKLIITPKQRAGKPAMEAEATQNV